MHSDLDIKDKQPAFFPSMWQSCLTAQFRVQQQDSEQHARSRLDSVELYNDEFSDIELEDTPLDCMLDENPSAQSQKV